MADRRVDYALIGGGLASANCARWLRESGADGSILLVGRESDLPYNRPPCSKGYLNGAEAREETLFRPAEWYAEQDIEVLTRVSAMKLDVSQRVVKLSTRQEVEFGQALVATGANVRRLNVPGSELEGIHYLRTLGNTDAIRTAAAIEASDANGGAGSPGAGGKRAVLIGGSYIASEVAASLTELGCECTMVMLEPVVLSRGFGERVGRFFQDRLEEHGVKVYGDDELERFEGADGRLRKVITKRGRELDADLVVIGAGVMPDVMLARAAGLDLGESGGVRTSSQLETSVPGIYAAGDMAEYESVIHGRRIRVEHWDVALSHGRTVGLNMLGARRPHDVVPYFFSDLSDWASLEYVGPAREWDQEVVRGSIEEASFSVWYLASGRLAGALSVGRSDDLERAREWIVSGEDLSERLEELADAGTELSAV